MNIDETESIDIGIDEKLNESFSTCVSLANTVVPVPEQEGSSITEDSQIAEPKKGDCYILNYQEFGENAKELDPRKGSGKDAMRLKHDFLQLNFEVHQHDNLTYKKTFHVLNKASRKDNSKSKYFVCCFLTHGGENGCLWAKDKRMRIDDILKIFAKSSSLKGIPKIFIIEACQGVEAELAVSTDSTDSCISTDTEEFSDFLIVNSTYPGTVSFKTSNKEEKKCHGSFFIDEFCHSLEEFSCSRLDFIQILTIVNYRMANMFLSHNKEKAECNKKKQMPCFYSTLKEKVYFNRYIELFVTEDTKWFDRRRKRHGSGRTTNAPRLNKYCITEAERVLFLSIVDQNIFKDDSCLQSAINLTTDMYNKHYSHKAFQGKFRRSEVLEFLDKNGNRSGKRIESKAKKSSEVECLICYIAAYSECDFVCDASGGRITKEEIVEKFIGQLNKSFVGKPKIFIFLLRKINEGEDLDKLFHEDEDLDKLFHEDVKREPAIVSGTDIETNGSHLDVGNDSVDGGIVKSIDSTDRELNTNAESTNSDYIGENLIPNHADILEICITIRDWKEAIGPMNLFRKILKKMPTEDLLTLLTEFNCELVEKHDFFEKSKKSFSFFSTLTKTLCLP